MTMSAFHICYLSALQAPPRSLAVNNKETVIVTVEPFWTEPYWRDLQLENLTLHYEFPVRSPENCEGDLITTESEHVEHMCKDSVKLEMDGRMDGETGGKNDEDYEHSEGYQEYDDSLPPEVAFDRDVFDGAKLLKVYYTIQVRRPRQLATGSDPFRDQTTLLDSEVLTLTVIRWTNWNPTSKQKCKILSRHSQRVESKSRLHPQGVTLSVHICSIGHG
jgi:hypothetical protein